MSENSPMNNKNDATHQNNLIRYNDATVVDYYAQLQELEPFEKGLFEKYIQKGARVLDIGVGGGRTTPWLAARAESYLGIDYAFAMVEACRNKFPQLSFVQMDATDLSVVASASIDVVVFSFNGIDCIHPVNSRMQCFHEVSRVLVSGGLFIFSEHNARRLIVKPQLHDASLTRRIWRILRSVSLTTLLFLKRPFSRVFRAGFGYEPDPVHGGLMLYATTPASVGHDLLDASFELVETAGVEWPARSHPWVTPWYYFVARKAAAGSRVAAG